MKRTTIHIRLLLLLMFGGASAALHADVLDAPLLSLPSPLLSPVSRYLASPLVLASATVQAPSATENETPASPSDAEFSPPLFSANKLHQYLGIGSLLFAGMAALTPPDDDEDESGGSSNGNDGFHHNAAVTAAALGGLAVVTGFLFHHDDIGPRYGIGDPDNLHMLLGLAGTLGYVAAVSAAPDESHAAAGILGLASMALAIKIEW